MTGAWGVLFGGAYLSGGTPDENLSTPACTGIDYQTVGCLTEPPKGLGLPPIRNEDVTYFQRDGVTHFSDWYEGRTITLADVSVCPDSCGNCGGQGSARAKMQTLIQAWQRSCCDDELVIFTDCHLPDLATGINLYEHGTFDSGVDGWVGFNGAAVSGVSDPVHSGAGALEIDWGTDPGPYNGPFSTGQAASGLAYIGTPGESYRVTTWLLAEEGQPSMVFGCMDSLGSGLVYSDEVVGDGEWHQVSVDYTIPDSGELIPFVVNGEATELGDFGYVDDVEIMLYNDLDRSLIGPFGVIGRPRMAPYDWIGKGSKCATVTLGFEAVDQRMYVLDECGTPGYTNCVQVDPGTQLYSRCYTVGTGPYAGTTPGGNAVRVRCRNAAGQRCYDTEYVSGESIPPTDISVGGTQKVNPEITLYPPLIRPYIENMTTGEWVRLDTLMDEGTSPVTINTENGTAFDGEGNSLTHLLRGSLFLAMFPGNYEWRLLSSDVQDSFDDPGYATICWRDTVIQA